MTLHRILILKVPTTRFPFKTKELILTRLYFKAHAWGNKARAIRKEESGQVFKKKKPRANFFSVRKSTQGVSDLKLNFLYKNEP